MAWSPDGRWVASGSLGDDGDGTLRIWSAETLKTQYTRTGLGDVTGLAWSPGGDRLASVHDDLRIWDAATWQAMRVPAQCCFNHAVWSPDARVLALADEEGTVSLLDASTGRFGHQLAGHGSMVHALAWSPDGRWLASGSQDHTVRIWDTTDGSVCTVGIGHRDAVYGVWWSSDGTRLVSVGRWAERCHWPLPPAPTSPPTWMPGVALAAEEPRVTFGRWTLEAVPRWPSSWRSPRSHSTDESLTAAMDAIRSWSKSDMDCAGWSPDGRQLALGGHEGIVVGRPWERSDPAVLRLPRSVAGGVLMTALDWSSDGRVIAAATDEPAVVLWDLRTGSTRRIWTALDPDDRVHTLAWSPDGRFLAWLRAEGTGYWWDQVTGLVHCCDTSNSDALAWLAPRSTLALASKEAMVLWDVDTDHKTVIEHDADEPRALTLSLDGGGLWCASSKGVEVWDPATGALRDRIEVPLRGDFCVTWSPDRQLLVSGGGLVRVWHATTGTELARFGRDDQQWHVQWIEWSPDGTNVLVGIATECHQLLDLRPLSDQTVA